MDLCLRLPVCPHLCFATRPAPQDLRRVNDGDGDDWREGKGRGLDLGGGESMRDKSEGVSCAIVSLTLSSLFTKTPWHDRVETAGGGRDAADHQTCLLLPTHCPMVLCGAGLGPPSCPLNFNSSFLRALRRSHTSHA